MLEMTQRVAERPRAPASRPGPARFRLAVGVYLATRVALLVLAVLEHLVRHHLVLFELANWDGRWFRGIALYGYPAHVVHYQTTLGFFPGYPGLMRLLGGGSPTGVTIAGLVISGIGGLVATV